jgi:hypothetical protein
MGHMSAGHRHVNGEGLGEAAHPHPSVPVDEAEHGS